jgi:hypothetical protein
MMQDDLLSQGKAKGGKARMNSLTQEQRREQSQKALAARWSGEIKQATHGSDDHPLKIGDIEIPCYVLEDGTRVLSQRGLQTGIGMSISGGSFGEQRLAGLIDSFAQKGVNVKDLAARIRSPVSFRIPGGGRPAYGYEATILADMCDVILEAREKKVLLPQQTHIAKQCEVLVRGFARVGIIALIDEATGYQRDRAANSLAKILEAFVAKELQPYVPTFPTEFYEQIFRLRGLEYSAGSVKRPQYFGVLTNDIIYRRLAPGVLSELKKVKSESGRSRDKLFQRLTANKGYPKLREILGSVITIMDFSNNWHDFMEKLNKRHPRYGEQMKLPFDYQEDKDQGTGL